jgi:4-amino-4-deoxy-L-arabinose transferase-like glycosyltransferase
MHLTGARRQAALTAAVLCLAAFNVTFRIGSESLTEWDGSLYTVSALEMVESGDWVGTTFHGALDYSNSKPPLNVWLIALSFKVFGVSLVSARVASVLSAWLTVLVLFLWGRRHFGQNVALLAALVLATTFGFLHIHSGRTANPDAPLTLLLLLIVVTLDAARNRPWRRVWLGPLLAGVFFFKGMAVLMPLLLVAIMEIKGRWGRRDRWEPLAVASLLCAAPIAAWAVARWQVDQWRFFERLFFQDFVALTTTALDRQGGTPLFYLNILQKLQYEWLLAAAVAAILCRPPSWRPVLNAVRFWREKDDFKALIGAWVAITLIVPALMQTKMPWYLNPFYPAFALGVGWVLNYGFAHAGSFSRRRCRVLAATVVLAGVVAESKLLWYSYHYRDLESSAQGLLLAEEAREVRGRRVFRNSWTRAETFVVRGVVRANDVVAPTLDDFLKESRPGEYLVSSPIERHPKLDLVCRRGRHALYRRRK